MSSVSGMPCPRCLLELGLRLGQGADASTPKSEKPMPGNQSDMDALAEPFPAGLPAQVTRSAKSGDKVRGLKRRKGKKEGGVC